MAQLWSFVLFNIFPWNIVNRRLVKDEEIDDLGSLLEELCTQILGALNIPTFFQLNH